MTYEAPKNTKKNMLDRGTMAKFRGVANSQGGAEVGASNEDVERQLLKRDGGFAATTITVTRMLQTGPPGLEHVKLEPLSPSIGTVIHGVDLADLSDAEVKFIRQVWLDRKVVCFRNQGHITHQQHLDFAAKFGDVQGTFGEWDREPSAEITGKKGAPTPKVPGYDQILRIESVKSAPGAASNWHSDATWTPRPPMASILIGRDVPPVGGATMYCDAYAMYEGLRPETKKKIENLWALHQGNPFGHGTGDKGRTEHPVLRTHPETQRTTLFVNPGFVKKIVGMDEQESDILLRELFAQSTTPEYQCTWKWENGSVAMWDNRACQHYGVGDFWPYERFMERVTIVDPDPDNKAPFYRPAESKL